MRQPVLASQEGGIFVGQRLYLLLSIHSFKKPRHKKYFIEMLSLTRSLSALVLVCAASAVSIAASLFADRNPIVALSQLCLSRCILTKVERLPVVSDRRSHVTEYPIPTQALGPFIVSEPYVAKTFAIYSGRTLTGDLPLSLERGAVPLSTLAAFKRTLQARKSLNTGFSFIRGGCA
jgi:hypothetical protein